MTRPKKKVWIILPEGTFRGEVWGRDRKLFCCRVDDTGEMVCVKETDLMAAQTEGPPS